MGDIVMPAWAQHVVGDALEEGQEKVPLWMLTAQWRAQCGGGSGGGGGAFEAADLAAGIVCGEEKLGHVFGLRLTLKQELGLILVF